MPFVPGLDVAVRSAAGAAGVMRAENQDNFLLIDANGLARFLHDQAPCERRIPGWLAGHARVAVLDGMGGHGQGREAAEAVVAGLLAMPPCASVGELSDQLDTLHASLQGQFEGVSPAGMRPGTTLTMLELRAGQAPLLYHVGDSRLYEITPDHISPLTIDHVPATAYAMAGVLDEAEWWRQVHGEHRSQISQAFILGNTFANPAELGDTLYELSPQNLPAYLSHLSDRRVIELVAGAVYVLATDGFWACENPAAWMGRWPALLNGRHDAAQLCERLFHAMSSDPPPGLYPDNLTAIVLRPAGGNDTALPVA